MTYQCQSKTLSPPDFESTYTNKVSLETLAVCQLDRFKKLANKLNALAMC